MFRRLHQMPKHLLLLRHAKSSWADSSLSDIERPLNHRGLRAAPLVGRFLRKKEIDPDLVVTSPAFRARETADLVIDSARWKCDCRRDHRIYEAGVAELMEVITGLPVDAKRVLIVGHNPGLESLAEWLSGERPKMRTASLASLNCGVDDWAAVGQDTAKLEWTAEPENEG